MDLKIIPSGQTIVKPTALGPVANTDTKLLIYGLFQKGRVLAQDGVGSCRRELLEHVVVLGACHLIRLVRAYISYYHEGPLPVPSIYSSARTELD